MLSIPATRRTDIYGVDFSGGENASKKIWIAHGVIEGSFLRIVECRQAQTLFARGQNQKECFDSLVGFIAKRRQAVFGIDFPFGLPEELVEARCWEDFVLDFPDRYADPNQMRNLCAMKAGGRDKRRVTDREVRTPLCPYNWRLRFQTFYGISAVLNPIVRGGLGYVLPMQRTHAGRAWVIEVCPASTLMRLNLSGHYKGKCDHQKRSRATIFRALVRRCHVVITCGRVRAEVEADPEGDGLDSIIAAYATFCALSKRFRIPAGSREKYMREGFVYA